MNLRILIVLLLLIGNSPIISQNDIQLKHLDGYFEKARKEWNVPGMAIAIVKNNKVIFKKGYGLADIESGSKVDENTLFAIASNSKAFTATALAILVEEGKLNWKDKVIDHLDYFRMYDPYVTLNMTVEDLLCHRSGLKTFSGDLIWYGSDKSAEEIVLAAAQLKPVYGFREKYGYSNIMYIAAGLIIEKLSGQSWSEFVYHRILKPLEMNRTISSTIDLGKLDNVASPYYYLNETNQKLQWLNWDNVVAAGGLISSVNDMSKWLIINLNEGASDDFIMFNQPSFEKLSNPHINFKLNRHNKKYQPSMHYKSYGLGWALRDLYGKKIITHGGGYDGMISKTWLVPEEGLGMVILSNSLTSLPTFIMDKSLDVLLGNNLEGPDYSSIYKEYSANYSQKEEEKHKELEFQRGKINSNHLPLASYEGSYIDPIYGEVKIILKEDRLIMDMIPTDIFYAELHHWNDHIFTFNFPNHLSSLPGGKLWFELNSDGIPNALRIEVINPDFDFMEFDFKKRN